MPAEGVAKRHRNFPGRFAPKGAAWTKPVDDGSLQGSSDCPRAVFHPNMPHAAPAIKETGSRFSRARGPVLTGDNVARLLHTHN
jgi:hypothetical protein